MFPPTKSPVTRETARRSSRGFTLTELLITMTLVSIVSAGIIPFFISNFRYLYSGEQKLLINSDIRNLTNELVETARASNYFVLYESFYAQTNQGATIRRDLNGNGTVNLADRLQAGQEGSFIVFVFYDDPFYDWRLYDADPTNNPALVNVEVARIVGYWIAPNRLFSDEIGMYVFDTDDYRTAGSASWTAPWGATFPATLTGATTVESLIPPATKAWAMSSGFEVVVNDMEGLSDNNLFFLNYQNRSVLVRAKILHGNQAKRVTNTYNFTITPRG